MATLVLSAVGASVGSAVGGSMLGVTSTGYRSGRWRNIGSCN